MIRLEKEGIVFSYHGDVLTWKWPWLPRENTKFSSAQYKFSCNSLVDYWKQLGVISYKETSSISKVAGLSMHDVISQWVKTNLRFGFYVVLHDINPRVKPMDFWDRVPEKDRVEFAKDVVILRCKDLKEVESLCDSVSTDFAAAEGIVYGEIVYWNENLRYLDVVPPIKFKNGRVD